MTTHLQINSNNLDIDGNWFKIDVEEEIQDILGRAPESDVEWIEWILGHDLADVSFEDKDLLNQIAKAEWITHVFLESKEGDKIEIIKK